jgi:FkbM family methyltransferase
MTDILKTILPDPIIKLLIRLKEKHPDSFVLKSYSQEGEDMILRRVFENQVTGFFVDVGAHHPKRFSNTYFFYKRGWSGINIDAMPGSMKAFEKYRPRDINIEKPISSKKQVLTYYAFNEPALNGFSKEISESRDGLNNYKIEFTKDIETTTLEEVLDLKLPPKQIIDFLSVDVEGLDFDVIKSINLKKYKPRVILAEILGANLAEIENTDIYKYLAGEKYDCYAKTVNTVIFKAKD